MVDLTGEICKLPWCMARCRNQYHYPVRRASGVELHKSKSLFHAALTGEIDPIKKIKGRATTKLPDNVHNT